MNDTAEPDSLAEDALSADDAPASPVATAPAIDLSVLVVDDEPNNLTSLEKIFRKEGWRVFGAANAREALEQLRKRRVDVVLTDLMMPGTSGI